MKNLVLIVGALASLYIASCGQKSKDVPAEVKIAFAEKFSQATNVKWDKENATEWEAEFKMNGVESSANFDLSGKWMETEYLIASEDLPATLIETLAADYADYKPGVAEVTETPEAKVFELSLKNGLKKLK
ncbi:MAG: PepSY-like domain-containing protein [Bacteroidales bacterium]|nr:PepSY-like domain-containing protein [Bacteroidales bacterium]MCF8390015.1 PepSY-like domain-containing protein [Bacteroidales bacterium]